MNQLITDTDLVKFAAQIVAANSIGQGFRPAELTDALLAVFQCLKSLLSGKPSAEATGDWRSSIRQDSIQCLICGKEAKVLAPHLKRVHNLSLKDYRQRFHIPASISLTSLAIKAQRSQAAKDRNLAQYLKR